MRCWAARYYADVSGRRVLVEYALIRDINDRPCRADLLAKRLRKHLSPSVLRVNVIPLNPTPGSQWDAALKQVEREFVLRVNACGVTCTVRDTRGQEIGAAADNSPPKDRSAGLSARAEPSSWAAARRAAGAVRPRRPANQQSQYMAYGGARSGAMAETRSGLSGVRGRVGLVGGACGCGLGCW
jgi:hypothetical protein